MQKLIPSHHHSGDNCGVASGGGGACVHALVVVVVVAVIFSVGVSEVDCGPALLKHLGKAKQTKT